MDLSLLRIIVELSFLSFFFVVFFIKRKDRDAVKLLLTALVYGLSIEILTLLQLDTYSYGEFIFVIGGVPLWIATSWGALICIAIWTSNKMFEDSNYLAFSDGLMLLGVDLIVEPIAVYLGFWKWHYSGEGALLGIPYGNFIAWFTAGFFFSFFFRFFKRKKFFEDFKYEFDYLLTVITALPLILMLNLFPKFRMPEIFEIIGFFTIITVSPIIVYLRCELREDFKLWIQSKTS